MSKTSAMKKGTGLRILVADDNQNMREVLTKMLAGEGYNVTTAESAERALDLLNTNSFPLIISDIRMPGMNGIELLQKIKASDSDTQVIIMTKHATLDTAISALRAGAYDYLLKPFEDPGLISAVVSRAVNKIHMAIENKILVQRLKRKNEELEQLNGALRDLAIRDGLTGLYNHRYFQESIALEIARSRRHNKSFSLIFIDVDHFKHYNDNQGHSQGDKLLCTLGEILRTCSRTSDITARYGGEEFILILPETPKEGAMIVAENIRSEVAAHKFAGHAAQPGGQLTVSIGVATFPEDGLDSQTLIQQADQALYKAKNSGRNMVCLT